MRNRFTRRIAVLSALVLTGCFHQVVQTGNPAGATVVDRQFVATWLFGLVPAQPIDVRQQCPSGVATIETKQSFINGLVGVLTLGIYTPQHLRVTCASGTAGLPDGLNEVVVPTGASSQEFARIWESAIQHTLESGQATVLRF
jgi:hypothetical protein